jgi:hypothetical protein
LPVAGCLLPVACCLLPRPASAPGTAVDKSIGDANNAFEDIVTALKSPADAANLPFFTRAQLATAAAWSPNPKNPPLYFDLPMRGGSPVLEVAGNWAANAPLAFIDQYVDNLRRYRAIAIDVGDQDGLRVDSGRLHDVLDSYGIRNIFDIYHGTHTSAVADRIQNHAVPFFSRNLCTTKDCK